MFPRIPRLALITVCLLFALLSLISLKQNTYNPFARPASSLIIPSASPKDAVPPEFIHAPDPDASPVGAPLPHRANATLFMLARNSEVEGAEQVVRELEERFNHKYNYPWVFLNEVPFSSDFKRRISDVVSGPVHFGQIPAEHWFQPSWINETRAEEERERMQGEMYGTSVPYRNMCRFNSGFFYHHPLLQNFRYYWRVEPEVHFPCDIDFDPFVYMHENKKTYGFTMALFEGFGTIASLWSTVRDFNRKYPQYLAKNNAMGFLSDNGGIDYSLCHFWSNFEIADMDFWRGEAYTAFFEYLDRTGNFYYERWGDAPVHSIAAGLFLDADKIHFFSDIGYEHGFTRCLTDEAAWERARCTCDRDNNFDYHDHSCLPKWDRVVESMR